MSDFITAVPETTESTVESWTSHNSPGKQNIATFLAFSSGAVLMIGFRNFDAAWNNAMAGFLLGVLLVVIAVWNFLLSGAQTIVVNPVTRRIEIEDTNRFRTVTRVIEFADVIDIDVGYLGKRSNFVQWYYLRLTLRSGEKYPLFAPGRYYKGGSNRSVVEGWKRRLNEYLLAGSQY